MIGLVCLWIKTETNIGSVFGFLSLIGPRCLENVEHKIINKYVTFNVLSTKYIEVCYNLFGLYKIVISFTYLLY